MSSFPWLTCAIALLLPSPTLPDNACTGLGTTAEITLICSGTCGTGTCESRGDGLDAKGAFSYCGCFRGDTDNCCTVVLRDGRARPRGTCPPCGAMGVCTLENNLPDGNLNEPSCMPKESGSQASGMR